MSERYGIHWETGQLAWIADLIDQFAYFERQLRRDLPMNVRRIIDSGPLSNAVVEEVDRIMQLWAQARARYGGTGEYLFGDWSAADIMFAPVVTRFVTYRVPVPPFAARYMEDVLHHEHVVEWIELAQDEPWVIEQYEPAD